MNEFLIIEKYIKPLVAKNKEALSLEDDVAVIDYKNNSKKLKLISTDCLIEDVHFFKDEDPKSIAYRLVISNLSDLASKGGKPKYFTLMFCPSSICNLDHFWLERFFNTIKDLQKKYKIKLIGGNTASSNSKLILSLTVIGESNCKKNQLPFRFRAKQNDLLFISKKIGDAYLGYLIIASNKGLVKQPIWLNSLTEKERINLTKAYYFPKISLSLGEDLIKIANSCTDASDGAIASVKNICKASNLKAEIKFQYNMFSKIANKIFRLFPNSIDCLLPKLINWGGDYNLVFSIPSNKQNQIKYIEKKYYKTNFVIYKIGKLTNNIKTLEEMKTDGFLKVKDFKNSIVEFNEEAGYIHK